MGVYWFRRGCKVERCTPGSGIQLVKKYAKTTKANDNVVSLDAVRKSRMVKPSGVSAFQFAAA